MIELLASRMTDRDFAAVLDIRKMMLEDSDLFASWASRALSLQKGDILKACMAEGHPRRLREAIEVVKAAGLTAKAKKAEAQLPQVASAYLASRLADSTPDIPLIIDAIFEAEVQDRPTAEERKKLQKLVLIHLKSLI